jgi:hypothetical protein
MFDFRKKENTSSLEKTLILAEKDIDSMSTSVEVLYQVALKYNPDNKQRIESAYDLLQARPNSYPLRQLFINRHIRPFLSKTSNNIR